jgi:hypothetical protein
LVLRSELRKAESLDADVAGTAAASCLGVAHLVQAWGADARTSLC